MVSFFKRQKTINFFMIFTFFLDVPVDLYLESATVPHRHWTVTILIYFLCMIK